MATAWNNLALCTPGDVAKELPEFSILLPNGAAATIKIQAKIAWVKERMALALRQKLRKLYPTTVASLAQYRQHVVERSMERVRREYEITGDQNIVPPLGMESAIGLFLEVALGQDAAPVVYYHNAAPTSETFAGTAENGAFLCDFTHRMIYINRGTKEEPDWSVFDTDELLDFLLNPEVLRDAAVAATIVAILSDRSFETSPEYESIEKVIEKLLPRWERVAKERFEEALGLLSIDISDDGTLSEFERTRTSNDAGSEWFALHLHLKDDMENTEHNDAGTAEKNHTEISVLDAQARIEADRQARLQLFIADVQSACMKHGGAIVPQVTIADGQVQGQLLFKVE